MARRTGLQSEVLLSLALVMGLATVVLAGVVAAHHEATLRATLGPALLAESRQLATPGAGSFPGTAWWRVDGQGGAAPARGTREVIDPETLELARRARQEAAVLLQPGGLFGAIRFAAPSGSGAVAVARLPLEATAQLRRRPLAVLGALAVANLLVFGAFGAVLLRRRVVRPLERLAEAARSLGEGAPVGSVEVGGPRETLEVGQAFDEMSEALSARTEALEKAVVDLREANADLRRARAGLDRAERLAAVGSLAAGVAHEVGNPIGAILGFLELAARDPAGEQTPGHLERAKREGERVRRILRQLLDFSRPQPARPHPLDLGAVAEETLGLLTAQRRYGEIEFELLRPEGLPPAMGDSGAITQILLNLLMNAADAVAGSPEPRIQVALRPAPLQLRAGESRSSAEARQRLDAVECRVADNGCGIPEEVRERIFDPFFTSKAPGEGTGLGLANAVRLAEEMDGRVECLEPEEVPEGFESAFALRLAAADSGPLRSGGVR